MKRIFILMLMACLWCTAVWADGTIVRKKEITEQFNIYNYSKMRITNQFGKIHLNSWNKTDVSVNVVITAKGFMEDKVQALLKDVNISIQKEGDRYSFYTNIKKRRGIVPNGDLQVDYIVNLPHGMYVELKNRFGDVFVNDFGGPLFVAVEYGTVKAQKLTGNVNLQVEFGSLFLSSAESATIITRYSKVDVDKVDKLSASCRFGKTHIGNTKKLALSQDYGDVSLSNVDVLKGDISYSGFNIDKMSKEAILNMQYCAKCNLGVISDKTQKLSVNAKFSKLECKVDDGTDMNVSIFTKYGEVHNLELSNMYLKKEAPDEYTNSYKGKVGAGNGNMSFKTEYTDINFK